jgi:protoporphyrinogen oxidase
LFDALERELSDLGTRLMTSSSVDRILVSGDRAAGVVVDGDEIEADAVLFTGALPGLLPLLPAEFHDRRWSQIGALGVVCVVVELRRPLSQIYWTNVCDAELPFGGIIEHTNLVPPADYGGRHIVYLSRYFTPDDAVAAAPVGDTVDSWLRILCEHFALSGDDVIAAHPFKTSYAAPLVTTGHLRRIPPVRTHLAGLYVNTTAQIYPQDRGMSEGVRTGREAAGDILSDLGVAEVV